jgi:hypothetical protein
MKLKIDIHNNSKVISKNNKLEFSHAKIINSKNYNHNILHIFYR